MYMFIYGNERNNQSWCRLIDRLSKFQLTRRCSRWTAANLGFLDGTTFAVSAAADLPMWRDGTASGFKDLRPGLNPILTAISFGTVKSDSMKCCEHTCLFAVLPSAVLSPARNFNHSWSCRLIRLIHSQRTCGSSGNWWNDPSNLGLSFLSLVRFEQPTTTQYTILLSVSNREALGNITIRLASVVWTGEWMNGGGFVWVWNDVTRPKTAGISRRLNEDFSNERNTKIC